MKRDKLNMLVRYRSTLRVRIEEIVSLCAAIVIDIDEHGDKGKIISLLLARLMSAVKAAGVLLDTLLVNELMGQLRVVVECAIRLMWISSDLEVHGTRFVKRMEEQYTFYNEVDSLFLTVLKIDWEKASKIEKDIAIRSIERIKSLKWPKSKLPGTADICKSLSLHDEYAFYKWLCAFTHSDGLGVIIPNDEHRASVEILACARAILTVNLVMQALLQSACPINNRQRTIHQQRVERVLTDRPTSTEIMRKLLLAYQRLHAPPRGVSKGRSFDGPLKTPSRRSSRRAR